MKDENGYNDSFKSGKNINAKASGGDGIKRWTVKSNGNEPIIPGTKKENKKIPDIRRGVLGISVDGAISIENLDISTGGHAAATERIIKSFDGPALKNLTPFEAGIIGTKEWLIIIQLDEDNIITYFPEYISQEQFEQIKNFISQKNEGNFSIYHNKETNESLDATEFLSFAETIISSNRKKRK